MAETAARITTPAIIPIVHFRHGTRSIDWLCEAFGFERSAVHADDDGHVHHAELRLGRSLIMGGSERGEGEYKRLAHPAGQAMLYVALDGGLADHLARARAAGAEIVLELSEKDYGGADYTARDPEGNLWTFGTYVPEVAG